jgi:HK97 gp10 family phage protein
MAKIEMRGMDAYLSELRKLGENTEPVCKAAVYAGAKVIADEIKQATSGLNRVTDAEAMAAYHEKKPVKISVSQKIGLVKSLGIAPITDKYGIVSTKVGFDGYNDVKTKRWPNGQPNAMVIRSLESGTSFLKRSPVITKAVRKARPKVEETMARAYDKQVRKRIGGLNG